jgi:putative spermidine/putrescine transport system permease protein
VKRGLDAIFAGLLVVVLVVTGIFLVVPIAMTVVMSFDGRDYLGRFPPPVLSLRWYTTFFFDSYYMVALRNSVLVSTAAATVATGVGVTAAVLLDRYRFRGREALSAFFLSPLVVPTVVMGFSVLMFLSLLGLYEGFVRLLAGHVVITVPYTIRTTLASLVGIKRSLVEAALSLGADERRAFRDVTLPLAKTGIVAGAVLAFALSFEEVSVSLFLYDPPSTTLPVAILGAMRSQFNLTLASAAVVMMAVTAVLVVVLDRVFGLDRIIGAGIYRS